MAARRTCRIRIRCAEASADRVSCVERGSEAGSSFASTRAKVNWPSARTRGQPPRFSNARTEASKPSRSGAAPRRRSSSSIINRIAFTSDG